MKKDENFNGQSNVLKDGGVLESIGQTGDEPVTDVCKNENLQQMVSDFTLDFQNPSRVLNGLLPSDRFRITDRSIEPIAIRDLQEISGIAYYEDETEASLPLVIRTPEGCFLMDGKNLVEHAKAAGEDCIFCEVDTIAVHDLTELCLRKAGIRSQTRGGRARYAELVRNAIKLESILLEGNSDLKSYAHGGRRFGEDFVGDREKDVKIVLMERLSKSRNTINNYLSHAKYISGNVMSQLIQSNKDKSFFEKFGRLKSKTVERLQEQRKTNEEITVDVSALILQCAHDGFPESTITQTQPETVPSVSQEDQPEIEQDEVLEEEPLEESTQISPSSNDNPIEAAKRSTREVTVRLSQKVDTVCDATSLYMALMEEIRALTIIAGEIAGLTGIGSPQEQQAN